MFGKTRRLGVEAALQAVGPVIRTFQIQGDTDDRFWNDEYVLGFIWLQIGAFSKIGTGGRIKGEDLGRCLSSAMEQISGRSGDELLIRCTSLLSSRSSDFIDGTANANKVLEVGFGSREFDDDPDVKLAVEMADAMGTDGFGLGATDRATRISGSLMIICFYERVRKRLNVRLKR